MPKVCKNLTACPIGCQKKHSDQDAFQADLTEVNILETAEITVKYFLNVGLEICQNKWKIIDQSIKNENHVILEITGLNSYSIKQDYSFIENPSIECLHLSFEQLICRINRKALDELFMHIQNSRNLKIFQLFLNQGNCNKEDAISKAILFEPIQGSLSNLERILFCSYLPQMNAQSFQCFERVLIDPKKRSGNLKTFQLNLTECDLNEKAFSSIAKILSYNRESLINIDIILVETDFQLRSPVNMLGKAFSNMSNLKEINIQMCLVEESIKSVAIDLKELFNGIKQGQILSKKEPQITLIFENILVLACSQIGDCLSQFSDVSYHGPLSVSSATDIGIALGKSSKLTNLVLGSERPELGLLLSYITKFTRQLRELHITYSGKNSIFYKDLGQALAKNKTIEILDIEMEIHKISFQSVQCILKGVAEMKKVFQLGINPISMGGEISEFYQIFNELSRSATLESVLLSTADIKINASKIDPKKIYLPLYSMDTFQELHMQLGDSFEKKLTKQGTKELLRGLIGHPRASSFVISNYFEDIQNVGNEFGIRFEILMLTTMAFYKNISPCLSFHPKQHLEDLYF